MLETLIFIIVWFGLAVPALFALLTLKGIIQHFWEGEEE